MERKPDVGVGEAVVCGAALARGELQMRRVAIGGRLCAEPLSGGTPARAVSRPRLKRSSKIRRARGEEMRGCKGLYISGAVS